MIWKTYLNCGKNPRRYKMERQAEEQHALVHCSALDCVCCVTSSLLVKGCMVNSECCESLKSRF